MVTLNFGSYKCDCAIAILSVYLSTAFSANPEENGPYFEGDIIGPIHKPDVQSGLMSTIHLWPQNTIYYEFDPSFPAYYRRTFMTALNHISGRTCIRFEERRTEADYIYISQTNGCSSYVGKIGGRQILSLAQGCLPLGVHIHEIMHAIGYYHEHSRTDRDDFVVIHKENIKEGYAFAFDKFNAQQVSPSDVSYDYQSILHYSKTAFSKNGQDTITPKQSDVVIGQRNEMSKSDAAKINNMYCPGALGIRFRSVFNHHYLGLSQNGTNEGRSVIAMPANRGDNQKWTAYWENLNYNNIGSTLWSWSQDGGKVKYMCENTQHFGVAVLGNECINKIWKIWSVGNDRWQIVSKHSGRCIASQHTSQVKTFPCNTNDATQLWNIYNLQTFAHRKDIEPSKVDMEELIEDKVTILQRYGVQYLHQLDPKCFPGKAWANFRRRIAKAINSKKYRIQLTNKHQDLNNDYESRKASQVPENEKSHKTL